MEASHLVVVGVIAIAVMILFVVIRGVLRADREARRVIDELEQIPIADAPLGEPVRLAGVAMATDPMMDYVELYPSLFIQLEFRFNSGEYSLFGGSPYRGWVGYETMRDLSDFMLEDQSGQIRVEPTADAVIDFPKGTLPSRLSKKYEERADEILEHLERGGLRWPDEIVRGWRMQDTYYPNGSTVELCGVIVEEDGQRVLRSTPAHPLYISPAD